MVIAIIAVTIIIITATQVFACVIGLQFVLSSLFCFIASIVFGAERLNRLGQKHWEKFATQNYFDENGFFLTIMLSTPLLVLLLVILVSAHRHRYRVISESFDCTSASSPSRRLTLLASY